MSPKNGKEINYGTVARILFIVEGFFFLVVPLMAAVTEAPGSASTNVLIVTTLIGFMTMVVQQFFAAYNVRKQHAFDLQDRDEKARLLAIQLAGDTEKLRLQNELRDKEIKLMLETRQAELERQQRLHSEAVQVMIEQNLAAIHENTKEARAAYHEANQANTKITALNTQNAAQIKLNEEAHLQVITSLKKNMEETQAGTVAAKEAYHEANQVNRKIADLQKVNQELLEGTGLGHTP